MAKASGPGRITPFNVLRAAVLHRDPLCSDSYGSRQAASVADGIFLHSKPKSPTIEAVASISNLYSKESRAMKDGFFWRVVAVDVVVGLFAVAYGLCRPSLVSSASAAEKVEVPKAAEPSLDFKQVQASGWIGTGVVSRAKVPGGWLVLVTERQHVNQNASRSITFYPDPAEVWDGGSLK
jgi:hypothetical protein